MTGALKALLAITGFALLLAIAPWPYEYFVMLRGLVSITAGLLAFVVIRAQKHGWLFLAIPAFLLWSPLLGVEMMRDEWLLLNLAFGIAFLVAWKSADFEQGRP